MSRTAAASSLSPPSNERSGLSTFLTCLCIGANSITALGAFTFPIIAPDLSNHLELSQSQLSSIVLAGLIGQYPFAALAGYVVDHQGPWLCSAAAAALYATGYGTFAWLMGSHTYQGLVLSPLCFRLMVGSYFLLGVGAVFSLFSVMVTASRAFPLYNGLAVGTTLALYGLSPLFLSLPSAFFVGSDGIVEARSYIVFIGSLAVTVHVLSIFVLRGQRPPAHPEPPMSPPASPTSLDEETPLLPQSPKEDADQTWKTVASDPYFWWIFVVLGASIGSAEMVIGNIGSVVTSMATSQQGIAKAVSKQVQLLSICNTASRLAIGPVIDIFCPNHLLGPCRFNISRFVIAAVATALLISSFCCMTFFAQTNQGTSVLSIGVGIAYGAMWTIMPGTVKIIWGEANFGRNFGMMAYAPFIGTTLWTYLFAFNVDRESGATKGVCMGKKCWSTTFEVCSGVLLVTMLSLTGLWRRWHSTV